MPRLKLKGTTSLIAWKKVIFVNLKKKNCIECFIIFQIYLCINNEYKVMLSNENIRFSASYPPSPESLKKYTLKTSVLLLHVNHDSDFLGIWSVYF